MLAPSLVWILVISYLGLSVLTNLYPFLSEDRMLQLHPLPPAVQCLPSVCLWHLCLPAQVHLHRECFPLSGCAPSHLFPTSVTSFLGLLGHGIFSLCGAPY